MQKNNIGEYLNKLSIREKLIVYIIAAAPFLGFLWGILTAFAASYNGLPIYISGNWMVAIYISAIMSGLSIFYLLKFFKRDSALYHPILLSQGDSNFFIYISSISNAIMSCSVYTILALTCLIIISVPNYIAFYLLFSMFFTVVAYLLKVYYVNKRIKWYSKIYDDEIQKKMIEMLMADQNKNK